MENETLDYLAMGFLLGVGSNLLLRFGVYRWASGFEKVYDSAYPFLAGVLFTCGMYEKNPVMAGLGASLLINHFVFEQFQNS